MEPFLDTVCYAARCSVVGIFSAFVGFLVLIHLRRYQTLHYMRKFPGDFEPIPFLGFLKLTWNVGVLARTEGIPARVAFFRQFMNSMSNYKEGLFVRYVAGAPQMVLFRADHVEKVMMHQTNLTKGFVYKFFEPLLGKGLLIATGNHWKSHRKMLTPAFHFRILDQFAIIINKHAKTFVERIRERDQTDDLRPYISALTLDVVCETIMGKPINCQTSDSGKAYLNNINDVSRIITERIPKPHHWNNFIYRFTSASKEMRRLLKMIHSLAEQVVAERTAELKAEGIAAKDVTSDEFATKSKKPFLDMLIAKHLNGEISTTEMRNEVDTFMFGGHDTTSVGLTFTLFLTGLHPEVLSRLHEEVDSVFQGNQECDVTAEHIKDMKYLDMVLKEVLRIFPPVSIMSRTLVEDMTIDEKIVPKGTDVTTLVYKLHRDPSVFPDPEKFDPERFSPENSQGRHPFAYLPFSAGPRNCIGQKFAMLEMKIIMCWLLRTYDWQTLDSRDDLICNVDIVLRPVCDVHIGFVKRKSGSFDVTPEKSTK